jgi:hypothetical protein
MQPLMLLLPAALATNRHPPPPPPPPPPLPLPLPLPPYIFWEVVSGVPSNLGIK